MHIIHSNQFSETNGTLHAFQQISDLKIFPECFREPLKFCGRPHAARGPVVGPHWTRWLPWSFTNPMWHSDIHVYINQLFCHCVFIYSDFHWQFAYPLLLQITLHLSSYDVIASAMIKQRKNQRLTDPFLQSDATITFNVLWRALFLIR